jgi:hypothetical protein
MVISYLILTKEYSKQSKHAGIPSSFTSIEKVHNEVQIPSKSV